MANIIGLALNVSDCGDLHAKFRYAVRVCADEKRTVIFDHCEVGEHTETYSITFEDLVAAAMKENGADY